MRETSPQSELGTMPAGQAQGGGDGQFGIERTGTGFEDADLAVLQSEGGKASADRLGIQHLVRQAMVAGARERSPHDGRRWVAEHQATRLSKDRDAPLVLQRLPALVRPLHQRHVAGVLEIGLADDP